MSSKSKQNLLFNLIVVGIIGINAMPGSTLADWPNFRGPNHDGISTETGVKTVWAEAIPQLWERQLGAAYSSFAAVGDRVYTCGIENDRQTLLCLDAETGKTIWKNDYAEAYRNNYGDGTRATPTVNDGYVYVLGGEGTLVCANAATGKTVWSKKFSNPPTWGYSGSVLIEGDLAIASGGETDGALVAFNKKTGDEVWQTGDDPVGYATPYPFTFEGKRYVVGFMGASAVIVEMQTGKQVTRIAWKTDWGINAAAPVFHNGHLFLTSGYKTGCGLFKLTRNGDKISAKPVWSSKALQNKFQSCVLFEGKLYASDQKGFKCVDFMTGKEEWTVRRAKHGTVWLAGENLFVFTEKGELKIGKASPEGFSPTTTAQLLSGQCWTVPVMHGGRLYTRNLKRTVVFDMRGGS